MIGIDAAIVASSLFVLCSQSFEPPSTRSVSPDTQRATSAARKALDTINTACYAAGARIAIATWESACARLVTEGTEIEHAGRKLLDRLPGLGYSLSEPGSVLLSVGTRILTPLRAAPEGIARFLLPPLTRRCQLVSTSGIPAALDASNSDTRQLGACVTAILLGGRLIPLNSSCFGVGFWPVEGIDGWRWTSGTGEIELARSVQPQVLEVAIRSVLPGDVRTLRRCCQPRLVLAEVGAEYRHWFPTEVSQDIIGFTEVHDHQLGAKVAMPPWSPVTVNKSSPEMPSSTSSDGMC